MEIKQINNLIIDYDNLLNNEKLQLCNVIISDEFNKKYNNRLNDYKFLVKNGKVLNDTIYRIGGLFSFYPDNYSLLMKHESVELEDKTYSTHYLKSTWCIIDKNGVEKVSFDNTLHYGYLVEDSIFYTMSSRLINIETKEEFTYSEKIESKENIVIYNSYGKDKLKRGMYIINKKTGESKMID